MMLPNTMATIPTHIMQTEIDRNQTGERPQRETVAHCETLIACCKPTRLTRLVIRWLRVEKCSHMTCGQPFTIISTRDRLPIHLAQRLLGGEFSTNHLKSLEDNLDSSALSLTVTSMKKLAKTNLLPRLVEKIIVPFKC